MFEVPIPPPQGGRAGHSSSIYRQYLYLVGGMVEYATRDYYVPPINNVPSDYDHYNLWNNSGFHFYGDIIALRLGT